MANARRRIELVLFNERIAANHTHDEGPLAAASNPSAVAGARIAEFQASILREPARSIVHVGVRPPM